MSRPIAKYGLLGNNKLQDYLFSLQQKHDGGFYLLSGPESIGKATLGEKFITATHCVSQDRSPCTSCQVCRHIQAGTFADHYTFSDESSIKIADIRALQSWAQLQPHYGNLKTLFLPDADRLTLAAQNALLKILEDGLQKTRVLFTTSSDKGIIPTIQSRAQILQMHRVSQDTMHDYAEEHFPTIDRDARKIMIRMALGAPGKFITFAQNPDLFDAAVQYHSKIQQSLLQTSQGLQWTSSIFAKKSFRDQQKSLHATLSAIALTLHESIIAQSQSTTPDTDNLTLPHVIAYYQSLNTLLSGKNNNLQPQIAIENMIIQHSL